MTCLCLDVEEVDGEDINEDFEEFAAAMWPKLDTSAEMFGLSTHDAEEAAQVTLVSRPFAEIGRLADSPAAYAYRSLMNHCRSRGRRARKCSSQLCPTGAELKQAGRNSTSGRGSRSYATSPPRSWCAAITSDLSEEVTAGGSGIPAGTVRACARALARLAKELRTGAKSGPS